jgi:chaperonin GroES
MNDQIQPLGGRVLVRLLEEPGTTASGIVLPDTAKEKPPGSEVEVDGDEHLILEATDLLAVVRTAAVAA